MKRDMEKLEKTFREIVRLLNEDAKVPILNDQTFFDLVSF